MTEKSILKAESKKQNRLIQVALWNRGIFNFEFIQCVRNVFLLNVSCRSGLPTFYNFEFADLQCLDHFPQGLGCSTKLRNALGTWFDPKPLHAFCGWKIRSSWFSCPVCTPMEKHNQIQHVSKVCNRR